jgi:Tol biopolymer transport system component
MFSGENVDSPAVSGLRRRLVYVQNITDTNIWHADLTGALRASGSRPLIASTRSDRSPHFSPDGKRIAFVSERSGRNEIWVCDRDGFGAEQLTHMNAPMSGCPRWSPDGQRIVFDSNAEGQYDVYVIGARGGTPQRLTSDPADDALGNWSRDGRWIYFGSNRTGRYEVWKMPATGGPAVQLTRNGGAMALESYDGKFVYYSRENVRVSSVFRAPVGGGEETKILDAVPPHNFKVVEDGIYFTSPEKGSENQFFEFATRRLRPEIQFLEFASGKIRPVMVTGKPGVGLAVSPDGRSILYTQIDRPGSDLMLVENFR